MQEHLCPLHLQSPHVLLIVLSNGWYLNFLEQFGRSFANGLLGHCDLISIPSFGRVGTVDECLVGLLVFETENSEKS